jgi:hypothetical protein
MLKSLPLQGHGRRLSRQIDTVPQEIHQMKMLKNQLVTCTMLASLAAVPVSAMADSDSVSGATPLSATANLDFRVVIPAILRFRVGTNGAGSIDEIEFNPPIANLGDGTDVNGTGGDLGTGVVTVSLLSNAGQITITESNNSSGNGLDNGAGDFIPYTEILTASSNGDFPAPALSDAANNDETVTPSSGNGKVTNRSGTWTYTYDNTDVYPAGDYGGSANGGRVTYTAASP